MWDLLEQTMHIIAQVGNDASTVASDASDAVQALSGTAGMAADGAGPLSGAAVDSTSDVASGTAGTPPTDAGTVSADMAGPADAAALADVTGAASVAGVDGLVESAELVDMGGAGEMGMLSFIAQSDFVGKSLFVMLLLMSLLSWYLIFAKLFANVTRRSRTRKFLKAFWTAASLEEVERKSLTQGENEPFSRLTRHAIQARNHHARYGGTSLEESGSTGAFVMRTMRKVIDQETSRLENGLTVLASIGSTSPFVGLFGTVWGVYHALIGIGMSDGVTVNSIAGPVGEALIMTGLGLAVAIPAVLAYNGFVRSNRVYLAQLDTFAHDLFSFLSTGQPVHEEASAATQPDLRVASGGK